MAEGHHQLSSSKRDVVARRQAFVADLLDTCVCHPLVASIMYTHQQSLLTSRTCSPVAARQPTAFAAHPKNYVSFATAENVLRLEALGYDTFEAYVFLSSAENVDRSTVRFAGLAASASLT